MATQHALEDFDLPGAAAEAAQEALPRAQAAGGDGRLAAGLGWFSVGLGLAEVTAPGLMSRLIGVPDRDDTRELLRAAGLRELASGAGILTRDNRAGWMWSRVGGDVMDLALLGSAFASEQTRRNRLTAATVAVAGVTALDVFCGWKLSEGGATGRRPVGVTRAITINRPPGEVYSFWHDFENLPRFMRHLESVRVAGPRRSHWVARGPADMTVEWDAELVEDRPNELIAWRSLKGADVENSGSIRFRPAPRGQGTELTVQLQYEPPGGGAGETLAWLFGEEPSQQLHDDLRRFKQLMETGEIPRSVASESALGIGAPGQPAEVRPYDQFAKGER